MTGIHAFHKPIAPANSACLAGTSDMMWHPLIVDSKIMDGGGQRMLIPLCRALADDEPLLVRPVGAPENPNRYGAPVERIEFPTFPTGMAGLRGPIRALPSSVACGLRLARLIRRNRCRIAIANELYAVIPLRLACFLSGIPLIFVAHSNDLPPGKGVQRLLSGCQRIAAVSTAVRNSLGTALAERTVVVFNTVDPTALGQPDPELRQRLGLSTAWILAFAGRIDANKNVQGLIRALHAARPRLDLPGRPLACLILGDGPERPACEALVRDLGLVGHIRFLGHQAAPGPIIAACDALVLPSFMEGLPLALIEGQLLGVPVLGTPVGGILDIIHHGETGWLTTGTDPQAIADGLVSLYRNPKAITVAQAAQVESRLRFGFPGYARAWRDLLSASMTAWRG